jgi:hypothetical protein
MFPSILASGEDAKARFGQHYPIEGQGSYEPRAGEEILAMLR